jgi:hypothetical protein
MCKVIQVIILHRKYVQCSLMLVMVIIKRFLEFLPMIFVAQYSHNFEIYHVVVNVHIISVFEFRASLFFSLGHLD